MAVATSTTSYEALVNGCALLTHQDHAFFDLQGDDAAEFLQGQVTNDIAGLADGQGHYAFLLTPKGQIRADLRALRTAEGVIVDCASELGEIVQQAIDRFRIGYRFISSDATARLRLLTLIGPSTAQLLPELASLDLHAHRVESIANTQTRIVRTALGADIFAARECADIVAGELVGRGAIATDWDQAEILRVETGTPRLGFEFGDGDTIPQEAGLNEGGVSFDKGCYVGQETVARLFYKGKPNRHLRSLSLSKEANHGDPIMLGDKQIGLVGTAVVSPRHGPIALALLRREATPGCAVDVAGGRGQVVEPGSFSPYH